MRLKSDHPILRERDNEDNNDAKDLKSASSIQKQLILEKLQKMAATNPELWEMAHQRKINRCFSSHDYLLERNEMLERQREDRQQEQWIGRQIQAEESPT